mgnify:CR=1 FL=1
MYNAKVKNYEKEALKTRVAGADRYEIIQMLMGGAIDKMLFAKIAIEKKSYEAKAEHISKSIAIIDALRGCLDFNHGKEISENLYSLYSYMMERLMDATVNNDATIVEEVSGLMREIKSGWDAIPYDVRHSTLNGSEMTERVG